MTDRQKEKLGLTFDEDGEFWMPWSEFFRYMSEVCVVHQMNTSLISFSPRYTETVFQGEWKHDLSRQHLSHRAGGCPNFRDSFLWNPQFAFDVPDGLHVPLFINLMQEDVRHRKAEGAALHTIGFQLMRIEANRVHRCHALLEKSEASEYVNSRSVFLRIRSLQPARYLLVPTTFEPGREAHFLLRFYLPRVCAQPWFLRPFRCSDHSDATVSECRELEDDLCGWDLRPRGTWGKCVELCSSCVPRHWPMPFLYGLKIFQGHNIPGSSNVLPYRE